MYINICMIQKRVQEAELHSCHFISPIFNIRQYRQCTYNATLRRVRATIVAVGKQ